jgi:hypothetical protein
MRMRTGAWAAAGALLLAGTASAQSVTFKDPVGDDKGPGKYVYPTDAVYRPGSFDLTGLEVRRVGDEIRFTATVNSDLQDPWRMGRGFSVQMLFVFVNTGKGRHLEGLPGLNVAFQQPGWTKAVVLSPQSPERVAGEVAAKTGALKGDILVARTSGSGRTIAGVVKASDLGGGDPSTWSYQVVMQSNEGFSTAQELMTRRVNEYEGQARFGGGNDGDCDPHVLDILAGSGAGAPDEATLQYKALGAYQCGPDGEAKRQAALPMVRKR